jgi:hypothetical protein
MRSLKTDRTSIKARSLNADRRWASGDYSTRSHSRRSLSRSECQYHCKPCRVWSITSRSHLSDCTDFRSHLTAFQQFTSGSFEFAAQGLCSGDHAGASLAAITPSPSASASGGKRIDKTVEAYRKGMAVLTVAKGGLMCESEHRRPEIQLHAALNCWGQE